MTTYYNIPVFDRRNQSNRPCGYVLWAGGYGSGKKALVTTFTIVRQRHLAMEYSSKTFARQVANSLAQRYGLEVDVWEAK